MTEAQTRAMMAYAHQEMLDRGFPQLAGLIQEELDRNLWPMDRLLVGAAREFLQPNQNTAPARDTTLSCYD